MYIYVLKLEDGKFYIGNIENVYMSIWKYLSEVEKEWLGKYTLMGLEEIIKVNDNVDVDLYVEDYMKRYGIDNVRGGSYKEIKLDLNVLSFLKEKIR